MNICPICDSPMSDCLFDGFTCEHDFASAPGFWGEDNNWDGPTFDWE